jgi:prepilin-type N-terminal cleavage/methylation domain-containing protein
MRDTRYENGFTLVELLVAMVVTSIVLTAVVSLAFALGTASDATDDTSRKQAQVRYATLRVKQLIRQCKLICGMPGGDLAVWTADNNGDGQININELVYIQKGPNSDYLRLCEFPSSDTTAVDLSVIGTLSPGGYSVTYVPLVPECSNVQFGLDALPPQSKLVSIWFELLEDNIVRQYQINAALQSWAGNLLNETGDALVSDDD